MNVFPVPGGPWMTASSLVSAVCKAFSWESSSSKAFAVGQEARFRIGTLVPVEICGTTLLLFIQMCYYLMLFYIFS